jgi:alpha-L-fucosidase
MKISFSLVVFCLTAIGFLSIERSRAQGISTVTSAPPLDPAALQSWKDRRFGMFIHWGPISQKGVEISWSRGGVRRDRNDTGTIPPEEYDNLYKTFDPEKFDATKWVKIAKAAGMKYIVIVAKHHDGFCMFDSKLTDYKITNSPFKRDVCAELAKACHKAGISLGFYYSPPDWHNPDFLTDRHKDYIKYMHGQVRELLTNYGKVDELWFDADGGTNTPETWDNAALFPMIRQLQPQVLITKRCGGWGDFNTPEQFVGGFDNVNPWESCMTISSHNAWAWGGDQDGVKSPETIIKMLVNCVGGDGNMLLNVGPQPDGEINAAQVACLKKVGAWMDKYGESIYGTRAGPFKPGWWGDCTFKGNNIYLHILAWKGDSMVFPPIDKKIIKSKLLGGGIVSVKQDDQDITVSVKPTDRKEIDTVVKLELDGPASEVPLASVSSGSIALGKKATASNIFQDSPEYGAEKAFDDDSATRWATSSGTTQAWLQVDLGQPMKISRAEIDDAFPGRVQSFELQYQDGDQWKTFYTGTTIGADFKTSSFPPVTAQVVRLNILRATEGPSINEFQLFSKP